MNEKQLESKCEKKCNLLSYDDLEPCETPEESKCMLEDFLDRFTDVEKCFKPKLALTFDVEHSIFHTHVKENQNVPTQVYIGIWSSKKEINEEIEVITVASLIGSIGGSLGMFFGFSIFTHLLYLLDRLVDKISKSN